MSLEKKQFFLNLFAPLQCTNDKELFLNSNNVGIIHSYTHSNDDILQYKSFLPIINKNNQNIKKNFKTK